MYLNTEIPKNTRREDARFGPRSGVKQKLHDAGGGGTCIERTNSQFSGRRLSSSSSGRSVAHLTIPVKLIPYASLRSPGPKGKWSISASQHLFASNLHVRLGPTRAKPTYPQLRMLLQLGNLRECSGEKKKRNVRLLLAAEGRSSLLRDVSPVKRPSAF